MKPVLLMMSALLLTGCISSVKITTLDPALSGGVEKAAILRLPSSGYPIRHNLPDIRSLNFAYLSEQALEGALSGKRKAWKIVPPTTLNATGSDMARRFAERKDDPATLLADDTVAMKKLARDADVRYVFVIENISIKDVSTQQVPASLVVGACLQLWDFKEGRLVYRARDTSRPIPYRDEKFKDRLTESLSDLFEDLISALPKK